MNPLHRSDDAEVDEPRDFGRIEVLSVLDAPTASRTVAVFGEGLLVDVQDLPVRPVADGVGVHLEAVLRRDLGGARDLLDRLQNQSLALGQILVGRKEPGTV